MATTDTLIERNMEPQYSVRSLARFIDGRTVFVYRLYVAEGNMRWRRHNKNLEFETEAAAHEHAEIWLPYHKRAGSPRI